MPQIKTDKINNDDLQEPIVFDGESGQLLALSTHSNLSQLDITINLQVASAVIQFFTTDIKKVGTPYEEIRLEMDSQYGPYYDYESITDNFFNLFLMHHWTGLNLGNHTFRVRDVEGSTYRNSKHIILILRT